MKIRVQIIIILMCACAHILYGQEAKSYMQMEVISPIPGEAPISSCDPTAGLWAEWTDNDNKIEMMDGTIWSYARTDADGNRYYNFEGATLSVEPGVTYKELKVIPDKTMIKVRFVYSFMGHSANMIATYGYIGEGKQPAIDYTSRTQTDFSYSAGDRYRKFEKTHNKCSTCSCTGYWGYKHQNGAYEGKCSNKDSHGHTCGHGPEKHGLKKW